jgi:hypothetical protein
LTEEQDDAETAADGLTQHVASQLLVTNRPILGGDRLPIKVTFAVSEQEYLRLSKQRKPTDPVHVL